MTAESVTLRELSLGMGTDLEDTMQKLRELLVLLVSIRENSDVDIPPWLADFFGVAPGAGKRAEWEQHQQRIIDETREAFEEGGEKTTEIVEKIGREVEDTVERAAEKIGGGIDLGIREVLDRVDLKTSWIYEEAILKGTALRAALTKEPVPGAIGSEMFQELAELDPKEMTRRLLNAKDLVATYHKTGIWKEAYSKESDFLEAIKTSEGRAAIASIAEEWWVKMGERMGKMSELLEADPTAVTTKIQTLLSNALQTVHNIRATSGPATAIAKLEAGLSAEVLTTALQYAGGEKEITGATTREKLKAAFPEEDVEGIFEGFKRITGIGKAGAKRADVIALFQDEDFVRELNEMFGLELEGKGIVQVEQEPHEFDRDEIIALAHKAAITGIVSKEIFGKAAEYLIPHLTATRAGGQFLEEIGEEGSLFNVIIKKALREYYGDEQEVKDFVNVLAPSLAGVEEYQRAKERAMPFQLEAGEGDIPMIGKLLERLTKAASVAGPDEELMRQFDIIAEKVEKIRESGFITDSKIIELLGKLIDKGFEDVSDLREGLNDIVRNLSFE